MGISGVRYGAVISNATMHVRKAPKSLMHRNINFAILESVRRGLGTTTKSTCLSFLISFFLKKNSHEVAASVCLIPSGWGPK